MGVKRVFLSFASEDGDWKEAFTDPLWFGNSLGNVDVVDYQLGGNLPFGPLQEWLETEINEAAVFVAFVSQDYIAKKYPLQEWRIGLSAKAQKKLVFVPVLIDAHAKEWWSELKKNGQLGELEKDYNYGDFTDGRGHRCHTTGGRGHLNTIVTQKIKDLAKLIKGRLNKISNADARDVLQSAGDKLTRGADALAEATGALPDAPVLTIELEEIVYEPDSRALREAVHDGFCNVVAEVINPPPQRVMFLGDMLADQLEQLQGQRAIVAIHDLNTGPPVRDQAAAKRALEQKLDEITKVTEKASRKANHGGLNLFLIALLVKKAEQPRYAKYPSPHRFENWRLLPFAEVDGSLKPKSAEEMMFRTYLKEWLDT